MPTVGTWRLGQWPVRERAEAWRQVIDRTHLTWRLEAATESAPGPMEPWVTARAVDDLTLVDCTTGACSGRRDRAELVADDGEFVGLLIVRRGQEHVEHGDQRLVLRPGQALLWDSTRPLRFVVPQPLVSRPCSFPDAGCSTCCRRRACAPTR